MSATNLFEIFRQTVERHPGHTAIADCDARQALSYRQVLNDVEHFADELVAAGVRPGDCVGLHVPSGRSYLVATYALWKCGACVVPIPTELSLPEKRQVCERICIHGVLSGGDGSAFLEPFQKDAAKTLSLGEWIRIQPAREHPPEFEQLNPAFIRFSSGTTGTSKGVVLSHTSILERILAANAGLQLTAKDRVVWLLSMSYHFTATIVAYLTFGSTIILPRRSVNLGRAIVEAAAKHRGTFLYGSPSQYELMARDRSGLKLDRVRLAISTAMALPAATADAFYRRFQVPLSQVYGIIEIGLPCANLQYAHEHSQSVGQLLPSYELRLNDAAGDNDLNEIEFRGPGFLDAYYDPWQPRSQIAPDGWFRTGDLGELDEHGSLFIRGRSKEMINVAGMKVFPYEVEAALQSHPAVREAVVFAGRRLERGEAVWAHVVLEAACNAAPTEAELRQHCAKHMAHFKVPERIEFVAELVRTASGKKLRRPVEAKP